MFTKRILPLLLLGILLCTVTFILKNYNIPITGGTDQNGYHVCAKRFLEHKVFWQKPVDDLQFIGSMWVVNKRGEYYPKYPPLYPLFTAGMSKIFGDGAGFYASTLGAILSIAAMYFLTSMFAGRWLGLCAAYLLSLSPVFEALGISRNSHTPSIAFLLWGLCAFFYGVIHRHKWWSYLFTALGGILVGYTVGIRYTDFLLILIPFTYMILYFRKENFWNHIIAICLGTGIPYGAMGLFHWDAYGAPWRSGYSLTAESKAFQWHFLPANLLIYVPQFFMTAAGPFCSLAFFQRKIRWKRTIFWSVWILPTFILYLTYYWAPDGVGTGTMRFLMPILPPVILLAVLTARRLYHLLPHNVWWSGMTLLLLIHTLWGWSQITRFCEPKAGNDLGHLVLIEECKRLIPEGSIIMSNEGNLNELDYEQRWTLYSTNLLRPSDIRRTVKRSLDKQAAGLQKERAIALDKKLGKMNYGKLYQFWRDFFQECQAQGKEVYFITRNWELTQIRNIFGRQFAIQRVGVIGGTRDPWIFREIKRDASRYYSQDKPVNLTKYEVWKLGTKRENQLSYAEMIDLLNRERSNIITLLNPENNSDIADYINRLESIRDERSSHQRAISAEKNRIAEQKRRKIAEEKRRLQQKKQQEQQRIRNAENRKKMNADIQRRINQEVNRRLNAELNKARNADFWKRVNAEVKKRLANEVKKAVQQEREKQKALELQNKKEMEKRQQQESLLWEQRGQKESEKRDKEVWKKRAEKEASQRSFQKNNRSSDHAVSD